METSLTPGSDFGQGLSDVPLEKILLPGSHDAGMYQHRNATAFGTPSVTLTQTRTIGQQLELGIRVFDMRPFKSGGGYLCGHYEKLTAPDNIKATLKTISTSLVPLPGNIRALAMLGQQSTWQGACGASIDAIVSEVNTFTANNHELVVLDLNGWAGFNTDTGNSDYKDFTSQEWQDLFGKLKGINNLFEPGPGSFDGKTANLRSEKLGTFIGNNKAAVICIMHWRGEKELGDLHGKGFFKPAQWYEKDKTHFLSKQMSNEDIFRSVVADIARQLQALLAIARASTITSILSVGLEKLFGLLAGYGSPPSIIAAARIVNMNAARDQTAMRSALVDANGLKSCIIQADAIEDESLARLCISITKSLNGPPRAML